MGAFCQFCLKLQGRHGGTAPTVIMESIDYSDWEAPHCLQYGKCL